MLVRDSVVLFVLHCAIQLCSSHNALRDSYDTAEAMAAMADYGVQSRFIAMAEEYEIVQLLFPLLLVSSIS